MRTAADAAAAFASLAEVRPRLILMDLQLPGMDGLELTRRIKADPATADIPIIAVTAFAMAGDEERARAAGCDGYVTKPIDTRALPKMIAEHLARGGGNDASRGRTVLVVEDNPATRKLVRFVLERHGYLVVEAPDGAAALRAMDEHQPALVLQDLVLPDLDGFTLVEQLRKRARHPVAILAFSGFASRLEEARLTAAQFEGLVTKPIEPSRLLAVVEAHLPLAAAPAERFGEGRTLLLVDDEPAQLKLTQFRLSRLGFHVDVATDGLEAFEVARQRPPSVIVSDVLMPGLDGFGLALAIRQEPRLASVPILLVTSGFVEAGDRDLARRAGATELVARTPQLRELIEALRLALHSEPAEAELTAAGLAELERDRVHRVMRQLERQVGLNAGLARRCSALAAELTVLTTISDAVLRHRNVDAALDEALAACFDAGGVSVGALYLLDDDGGFRVRKLGGNGTHAGLDDFFGRLPALRRIIERGVATTIPGPMFTAEEMGDALHAFDAQTALVLPLVHVDRPYGAMLMIAAGDELDHDDWRTFAQGVANQIAQTLALANAFADREKAEQHAAEQATLLQLVLDSMAEGVVVADKAGEVVLRNRAARALNDDGVPLARATSGERIDDFEYVLRHDGEHSARTRRATGRPLIGPDGEARGGVVVFRDVTAQKQAEAQLIVSDRMASVGTLAAGVAHEINNPLASVMANLELARRDVAELTKRYGLSSELTEELRDAAEAAERMRLIVRDLKIFSRAEEDERLGPVDVRAVLESTVRIAYNELRHRARLVKDYGKTPPVMANESRLGQVFLNILVNAAQAIPEGDAERHEVKLRTYLDDGRVVVAISDDGSGIPPDVMRRLFTPFMTTKPIGEGTGLGLSICHRIVTALGGEIQCDSEVGKGTEFRVILPPSRPPTAELPRAPEPAPPQPKTRRARILCVDDEPMVASAVKRLLRHDHDITTAGGAEEALALMRDGARFDVILCDLMMPQMTGMDLHAELERTIPEQAAVMVFLTGGAFTARAREFLDGTARRRIEKPFDLAGLRAAIRELLG